jgi:hypothetical protein
MFGEDELGRMWKEIVMAYFKILEHFYGWSEKILCQDIRPPGRKSNSCPAEYEAG